MPSAVRLPPRSALRRDVEVPVLPGLGLTWYDRGPRYWARRAGLAFMWAVVLTLIGAIDVGLFGAIRHSSRTGFLVFAAIDAALTVALLVFFAVRTVRRWNVAALPAHARTVFRVGRGRAGTLLSGLVQIGYTLAVLIAAIAFLFFPGFFLLMFLTSLLPEPPAERQARLWMAERLRERGYEIPAG